MEKISEMDLLRVDQLRPHEEILPDRIEVIRRRLDEEGLVDYPILTDRRYHVILDGHHRFAALRERGVERVPVVEVDYHQDSIVTLEARKNCPIEPLTKQDVLRKGLSDDLFPPKSTRHTLRNPLDPCEVPLKQLA